MRVDVTFGEADLAAVCNSERLMVRRWGRDGFEGLGRRLLELAAAADLDQVALLPGADVTRDADGAVTIDFGRGAVVVHGEIVEGLDTPGPTPGRRSAGLHILGIEMRAQTRKSS